MTNRSIRVLVVDDEAPARRRLLRFLRLQPDVEVVGACASGPDAIAAVRRSTPDIVFLDVQMPEVDGFEVLSAAGREHVPRVVFVTAHDQYAVRAFEVGALDYLLKPFGLPRFEQAFQRVRADLERDPAGYAKRLIASLEDLAGRSPTAEGRKGGPDRYLERVMIKKSGRVFFIRTSEIDWVEAADNYVCIHVGESAHFVRQTLQTLETSLDPRQFARIHRGALVNLDSIREIEAGVGRGSLVILKNGTQLRLSERHRRPLEERGRLGGPG